MNEQEVNELEWSHDDYDGRSKGKIEKAVLIGTATLGIARQVARVGLVAAALTMDELGRRNPRTQLRKGIQDASGVDKNNLPQRK